MTQLGEAVMMGLVPDGHDAATCPFCQAAEPRPEEAITREAADEHATAALAPIAWKAFHNDAKTLGRRLLNARGHDHRPECAVTVAGHERPVWTAAHHLIPGKESLQVSDLYRNPDLLWKDGTVDGNIGYDVNRAENGEWLPGSYAITGWGPEGSGFVAMSGGEAAAPELYAWAAITALSAQFHDRHNKYSEIVKDGLDRLNRKLAHLREAQCPEAQDATAGRRALPQIVVRLDRLSARLRSMVRGPDPGIWKTDLYTSRFNLSFMRRPDAGFAAAASSAPPPETGV